MHTLITADHLVRSADEQPISPGAVLVEDEVILAAGPADEVAARAGSTAVVRAHPGGTILPGLMDAHVHLAFDGTPGTVAAMTAMDDADLLLDMAGHAQLLLDAGVTTVRDLGDRNGLAASLRDAIAVGKLEGPRILAANAPVTVTGGHCWFFGGEADGIDDLRRVVRRNVREGADVIKVMASGGNMTPSSPPPWQPQFTVEELRAIVEEAHRFGRPTAAHAHNAEAVARAVAAGIDSVEHCGWATRDGSVDRRPEVIAQMKANGTVISPTVGAAVTRPPYDSHAPRIVETLAWYRASGVTLVGSTDAGATGTGFGEYARTFPLWAQAGFTPAELLRVLTLTPAQAFGIADRVGRLHPGFEADLIVTDGNPLEDLSAFGRIRLVVARGRARVPRSERAPVPDLRPELQAAAR
ncbi:amidohydrolase family protein [Georgenia sp. TF02-10]|uniref:amidohydrolase family protein n=1 Tax=Georgenia sp. TF02-10 TaxID=2917725 RepID=UPI001FA7A046|nr:amidohydrolase family protein [Georgenia sp. TF02-10]UNX53807.1 amidohydrolase family protein [Georgenia sp. TF02-10]